MRTHCHGFCLNPGPEPTAPGALLDTVAVEWPFPDAGLLDAVVTDAGLLGARRLRLHPCGVPGPADVAALGSLRARFAEVQMADPAEGIDDATRRAIADAGVEVLGPAGRPLDGEGDLAAGGGPPLRGPRSEPPFWPPVADPASVPARGRTCLVRASGTVVPCAGVDLPLGDVRRDRLAEIVRTSEVLEAWRAPGASVKGPCAACPGAPACTGCRGAAFHATGDYLGSDPTCPRNAGRGAGIDVLPVPAGPHVPHAAPMLLVDAIEEVGDRVARVAATVRPDHPFLEPDGTVDPLAFPEMSAQAVAAVDGFAARGGGAERRGMLLGIRDFATCGVARAGDRITITVRKAGRLESFGVFEVRLACGGAELASGRITTWSGQ